MSFIAGGGAGIVNSADGESSHLFGSASSRSEASSQSNRIAGTGDNLLNSSGELSDTLPENRGSSEFNLPQVTGDDLNISIESSDSSMFGSKVSQSGRDEGLAYHSSPAVDGLEALDSDRD